MISKLSSLVDNPQKRTFIVFILPSLVVFVVFIIYPMVDSLLYSLYRWNGLIRTDFIGLENFKTVLFSETDPIRRFFWNAVWHNIYSLSFVLLVQTSIGFGLALMLFQNLRGSKFFQSVIFLPVTLSVIVVGFLFKLLLHPTWGIVNHLIRALGFANFSFPWLGDFHFALTAILLVDIWRWAGLPALIFLAGLNSIPQEIIEAALLDGCSGIVRIFRIYIPLLIPQFLVILILTVTGNLMMFDIVYALVGPDAGPNHATDVLGTLFYRTAFGGISGTADKGLGAAIGAMIVVLSTVISIILVISLQRIQARLYGEKGS